MCFMSIISLEGLSSSAHWFQKVCLVIGGWRVVLLHLVGGWFCDEILIELVHACESRFGVVWDWHPCLLSCHGVQSGHHSESHLFICLVDLCIRGFTESISVGAAVPFRRVSEPIESMYQVSDDLIECGEQLRPRERSVAHIVPRCAPLLVLFAAVRLDGAV